MNEPQVWALIGVFAASMFGMVGVLPIWLVRGLRAEIGGLRGEMIAGFQRVDEQFKRVEATTTARFERLEATTTARFERLEATTTAKFDQLEATMDARFGQADTKLDRLDRDVKTLFGRVFPETG